jgi:hypothetical protein
MPNPQQPELARSRKSDAVTDDALPTKASRRVKGTDDVRGPVPEDNRPGHQPDVVPDKPMVPPDAYRMHPGDDGGEATGTSVRYAFRFDALLAPFALPLGVTPRTAWLQLDDDSLAIRFGLWSLRTSRDNVAGAEVTGPYNPLKVVGPPHLSLRDRGVTFATSRQQGACIRFREPVGLLRHPAVTVTVTDPVDLVRRLSG